jgi:hypothetical protein
MNRIARKAAAVIMGVLLLPAAAHAQAAITGVVRDTSGAVVAADGDSAGSVRENQRADRLLKRASGSGLQAKPGAKSLLLSGRGKLTCLVGHINPIDRRLAAVSSCAICGASRQKERRLVPTLLMSRM